MAFFEQRRKEENLIFFIAGTRLEFYIHDHELHRVPAKLRFLYIYEGSRQKKTEPESYFVNKNVNFRIYLSALQFENKWRDQDYVDLTRIAI